MIRPLLAHPARTLAVLGLVTAGLATAAVRVQTDNTAAAWLPASDPDRDTYSAFRERFGGDTFVLVATADADVNDPAVRESLLEVGQQLEAIDGVVSVRTPFTRAGRVARAREEMPRTLAVLAAAGDDPRVQLLRAEANAALTFLLLEPDTPAARENLRISQQAALAALAAQAPEAAAALREGKPLDPATFGAGGIDPAPVFWWAFARGAEIRAGASDPALLEDLTRVDAVMRLVLDRDETFFAGGPHLYFAMRHVSLGRSLGGDPQKSVPHFEAVERITGGVALLPRVLRAQHLAPTLAATPRGSTLEQILAAQRMAWDAFHDPLQAVLAAPVEIPGDPALTLANAVARERAAALLAEPGEHGVIAPKDVEVVVPELAATVSLDDTLLSRFLVSPDHRRAALLVSPKPDLGQGDRAALIERIEATLGDASAYRLAGPEVITHDMDVGSVTSFGILFPVVLFAMGLVLWLALRSHLVVIGILITAGLVSVWTLGLIVLCGRTLNMIVVVLPAILAVLTTAYSLHLVSRYLFPEETASGDRIADWQSAAKKTFAPCLLTALTTAAGFASLVLSEIPPVRDLGLFAAIGVWIAFGLTFTFLPTVLSLLARVTPRPQTHEEGFWTRARADRLTAAVARRAPLILALAALLGVGGAVGLKQLRFESHVLRFFPDDHRLPKSTTEIEDHLLGLTPLEVWVEGPRDAVLDPANVNAILAFVARAREQPLVTHAISPFAAGPLADQPAEVVAALLRARLETSGVSAAEAAYLVPVGDDLALRVTLACRTTYSEEFHHLVESLGAELPTLKGGVRIRLSGAVPLLVRVQALLVDTQLRSFSLALLVVTVILFVAYRSPKLVAVSLLPNVLPILLTLGCMGFADIPLNTATVTVAGIALGLVVHDTIHFLHHHHHGRLAGLTPREAVTSTLEVVGRPIATTTLAVAIGFGAFVVSPFRPTHYFGLLIAVTCLAALVCDLVFLPALLLLRVRPRLPFQEEPQ